MNPFIQNALWFATGIVVAIVFIKYKKGPCVKKSEEDLTSDTSNTPLEVNSGHNDGQTDEPSALRPKWTPAEIAVKDNLKKIIPLLDGVSQDGISNMDKWKEIIVSINNEDLTDMWKSAINRPNLWITYLQTFGLQRDLTAEFTCISEYRDMYSTEDDSELQDKKTYKVITPCWIYTDNDNNKEVVLKGVVKEKLHKNETT